MLCKICDKDSEYDVVCMKCKKTYKGVCWLTGDACLMTQPCAECKIYNIKVLG